MKSFFPNWGALKKRGKKSSKSLTGPFKTIITARAETNTPVVPRGEEGARIVYLDKIAYTDEQ